MSVMNQIPKDYPYMIFDLDGTMVDTCPDIVGTVQHIIEKYGFEEKSPEFIRSCIGGGARNVLLKCLGAAHEAIIDSELLSYFAEYYTNNSAVHSKMYPGLKQMLALYKAAGHKLAVATFKIRSATLNIFETFGLMDYFDIIVTADDVANPKPAPDCINAILDYYGCDPSEAVLIGDTKTDYLTGTNAGVDVCAVTFGYNTPEVMASLNPAYLVDDFCDLAEVLLV